MTNEELKAKLEALTSVEDAYALAKECGFTGSMEDFKAAGKSDQMDLDAMDSVAGGTGLMDGTLSMVPENVLLEREYYDMITKSLAEQALKLDLGAAGITFNA